MLGLSEAYSLAASLAMSRSRRKNPIVSIACAGGKAGANHGHKTMQSRIVRRNTKEAINAGDYDIATAPAPTHVNGSPGDGKQWWQHPEAYRK